MHNYLKIQEWQKTDPGSTHFFRPYVVEEQSSSCLQQPKIAIENEDNAMHVTDKFVGNDGGDDTSANDHVDKHSYKQPLLWVHQTDWQKDILHRYGNTMSMLDATYKTTCYELALFFVCVRTNVGYSVVAEFVVHSESAENIQEALQILKKWNPDWTPRFFMTDYSEAELNALELVFPKVTVYLCDFHREQAWVRWTRDHKHGLSSVEAEDLLQLLRACAWACPGDSNDEGVHYRTALRNLKSSHVWQNNPQVRQWLESKWLPISKVNSIFTHTHVQTIVQTSHRNYTVTFFLFSVGQERFVMHTTMLQ